MADTATSDSIRLTEWTACGGCAAKWGAAPLSALVRDLAASADDLVASAGFFRIGDVVAGPAGVELA